MDVESIFSIGIIYSFFGAVASQLPLTKIRNFSYLFPAAGALLFLSAGRYLPLGPAFPGGTISVSPAYSFAFSDNTRFGLFTVTASLMTFALSFFLGGMK